MIFYTIQLDIALAQLATFFFFLFALTIGQAWKAWLGRDTFSCLLEPRHNELLGMQKNKGTNDARVWASHWLPVLPRSPLISPVFLK